MVLLRKRCFFGSLAFISAFFGLILMNSTSAYGYLDVGDMAPDFTLFDVDNHLYSLSDYLGNVVYLAFTRSS